MNNNPKLSDRFTRFGKRFTRKNCVTCSNDKKGVHPNQIQDFPAINVPSQYAVPYRPDKKNKKVKIITQCDFDTYGKNGIIIDKSGRYCIKGNIKYCPTKIGTSAISITSSDVILDLGRFTFKQDNSVQLTYGIAISRDSNRVLIKGVKNVAEILDFTLAGIRILGRTETITLQGLIVSQSQPRFITTNIIPECTNMINLNITNGIVVGEGDTGYIAFKGTDRNNIIKDLTIKHVTSRRAVIGLHVAFTFEYLVEDCLFTENSRHGFLNGNLWLIPSNGPANPNIPGEGTVVFPVVSNGTVRRVRCDRNIGRGADIDVASFPVAAQNAIFIFAACAGFGFNSAQDCTVQDSSASDNFNTSELAGVDHDGSMGMVWKNCVFNNNVARNGNNGLGYNMSGSIPIRIGECSGVDYPLLRNINTVIEDCVSNNNLGGFSAFGFSLFYISKMSVKNCVAQGMSVIDPFGNFSAGYFLDGQEPGGANKDVSFTNCIAQDNGGLDDILSFGFGIAGVNENIIIEKCISNDNGKNGAIYHGGIGIATINAFTPIKNIVIRDNIVNGNGTETPFGGGIILVRDTPDTDIQNVLIEGNTVTYSIGTGILVFNDATTTGSITGVVIKKNEVDQSTVAGIDVLNAGNPVLVAKNIAYSNNGTNYVGVPVNDIIEGTIGTLPDTVGFKNLSIETGLPIQSKV